MIQKIRQRDQQRRLTRVVRGEPTRFDNGQRPAKVVGSDCFTEPKVFVGSGLTADVSHAMHVLVPPLGNVTKISFLNKLMLLIFKEQQISERFGE